MAISEVVRDSTAVNRLEAFPALGIRVKAQSSPRTAGIVTRLLVSHGGLLDDVAQGVWCAVGDRTRVVF